MSSNNPTILFALHHIARKLGLTAGPAYAHNVTTQCVKQGVCSHIVSLFDALTYLLSSFD